MSRKTHDRYEYKGRLLEARNPKDVMEEIDRIDAEDENRSLLDAMVASGEVKVKRE